MNGMIVKGIIILFLLAITFFLGSALYYLVRDHEGGSSRTVKALTWRIGLTFFLFALLLIFYAMGWIAPQ